MKKLPKAITVRWETPSNGPPCLLAFETQADAVEDDGPTTMGIYQLVDTCTLKKVIASAK